MTSNWWTGGIIHTVDGLLTTVHSPDNNITIVVHAPSVTTLTTISDKILIALQMERMSQK